MDENKTAEEVLGEKIKWYLLALIGSLLILIILVVLWWRSMREIPLQLNDPNGSERSLLIWVIISFVCMVCILGFWWIVSLRQNVKAEKYPDYKAEWKLPNWVKHRKVKVCLFIITILILLFMMIGLGLIWTHKAN